MKSSNISPHEPEEQLLSAEDVVQDVATLERILAEARAERLLKETLTEPPLRGLIDKLIASGTCRDEREVLIRAIESFFVAVIPESQRRIVVET